MGASRFGTGVSRNIGRFVRLGGKGNLEQWREFPNSPYHGLLGELVKLIGFILGQSPIDKPL